VESRWGGSAVLRATPVPLTAGPALQPTDWLRFIAPAGQLPTVNGYRPTANGSRSNVYCFSPTSFATASPSAV
jgi:hypothetical protein